ncbi:MAG: hypothetical protein WC250_02395 [Candidatus Paceibacterota bacterium]|jgi:hypothetical protein
MTASIKSQKVLSILVLIAFMAVAVLSFSVMMHQGVGEGGNGCLFATGEVSLCPQNALALVAHHISAYLAFINVPVGSSLFSVFAFLFALLVLALLIIRQATIFSSPNLVLARSFADCPPRVAAQRKIIRWLSLLENSPAF